MIRPSTRVDLAPMMPTKGILPYYVSEASKLTRAPAVYHLASIVTVMGAILDPISCAYLVMGDGQFRRERLFLWTLLIGPSGNKKTYSGDLALRAADKFIGDRIRSAEGGRKALEEMLLEERNPVVHEREAAGFFAGNRMAYMGEGASFWNRLYDGYHVLRNRSAPKAKSRKIRVGVSMLMMGPEDEILRTTKRPDWMGGLIPRLNICHAPRIQPGEGGAEWPERVLKILVGGFERMKRTIAPVYYIRVSQQARLIRKKWESKHDRIMARCDDLHENIGSRVPWHVLRFSAIFAASRFSTVVESEDMVAACNFGRFLRNCARSMSPKT